MRKIPATMATQHPDNAMAAYWDEDQNPFISAYQEISEAVRCFDDLGVSEYMWDWEGKHADAAVIDRLFSDYYDYFKQNQLGKDKFLTFRIPNIWEEKGYNLLQAMTVILSSEDFARDLKFYPNPLFEIILPMTESAEQLIHIQKLFKKLSVFKSKNFTPASDDNQQVLEMIPLVESVDSQLKVGDLLDKYVQLHQKAFGTKPVYIRPFLARSDPALVSGNLATVLANKLGLNQVYQFSKKHGIPVFPISGVGSLPFRGGLTPGNVDQYVQEYAGMRTVSIQSSFRYDHAITDVATAINRLETELPKAKHKPVNSDDYGVLNKILLRAKRDYYNCLSDIISDVEPYFASVPRRRDRRQHIGLLAYGRKMGTNSLPRAITFTAGMYSIGLPPEFIGLGKTLKSLNAHELATLKRHYHFMSSDYQRSAYYINMLNINAFAEKNSVWKTIKSDIELAAKYLDLGLGPENDDHKRHLAYSLELKKSTNRQKQQELINKMAVIRKSLG